MLADKIAATSQVAHLHTARSIALREPSSSQSRPATAGIVLAPLGKRIANSEEDQFGACASIVDDQYQQVIKNSSSSRQKVPGILAIVWRGVSSVSTQLCEAKPPSTASDPSPDRDRRRPIWPPKQQTTLSGWRIGRGIEPDSVGNRVGSVRESPPGLCLA